MKLIFEKSVPGRGMASLPACDVVTVSMPAGLERKPYNKSAIVFHVGRQWLIF